MRIHLEEHKKNMIFKWHIQPQHNSEHVCAFGQFRIYLRETKAHLQ